MINAIPQSRSWDWLTRSRALWLERRRCRDAQPWIVFTGFALTGFGFFGELLFTADVFGNGLSRESPITALLSVRENPSFLPFVPPAIRKGSSWLYLMPPAGVSSRGRLAPATGPERCAPNSAGGTSLDELDVNWCRLPPTFGLLFGPRSGGRFCLD